MTNPKGTYGETGFVNTFHRLGDPSARRVVKAGSTDMGDVSLFEDEWRGQSKWGHTAQNASEEQIRKWLIAAEAQAKAAGKNHAVLLTHRKGVGVGRAELCWAHIRMRELYRLSGIHELPTHVRPWLLDHIVRFTVADFYRLVREAKP